MSRNSMLTGRNTENFSYDSLGRLVRTYTPHNRQTSLVEYTTNGNIASKTGVGSYYYESSRPHAVTLVDNTDSIVSTIPQYVTYTPFNKVQTVTQGDYELAITYGPDQQRNKTTLSRNDTLLYTRYYADNYEEVHSGNDVYYYYYIHTPDGLTNVAEKKNSTITIYSAETDYLGSIVSLYNKNGQKVFRAEYDAWGKQNVVTDSLVRFQRGYCNHEHWREFDLIDMNGRMYDPIIARFLSPDPFVQAPKDLQNYNRYSYCLNNPLKYTDPNGESIVAAAIIGAVVGAYIGGSYANKSYNPGKWKWSSNDTWKNMFLGSVVGGISGAIGGTVAACGMPFANTASIACSSLYSSVGTSLYTGGQTPVSISFGVCSYDFTNNKFGYLGKKGNSKLENLGYTMGALANVQDLTTAIMGDGENIYINSASTKGKEHDWWGHSSATRENGKPLVSVGPDSPVDKSSRISETFKNSVKNAENWNTYFGEEGTWSIKLNNVSTKAMSNYASKVTSWDLLLNSCVGHTTRSLWRTGIPTLYAFHPHMLNVQLLIRQIGIYSSPYIYQLNN